MHESAENLKERGGYLDDVCEILILASKMCHKFGPMAVDKQNSRLPI